MSDRKGNNSEMIVGLTSDIVAAHVSNNRVEIENVPDLISKVFSTLAELSGEANSSAHSRAPSVPVHKSVRKDQLICLECGKKFKMLKRHINVHHGFTPGEYQERWNLPSDYPMVAKNYAEVRRSIAKENGLGRMRPEES